MSVLCRKEGRLAKGLCVNCGTRPHRVNKKTCQICSDTAGRRMKRWLAKKPGHSVRQSLAQDHTNGRLSDPYKALAIAVFGQALTDAQSTKCVTRTFSHCPTVDERERDGARQFLQAQHGEWARVRKMWFQYVQDDLPVEVFKNQVRKALTKGNSFRVEAS
jgi:hypothetical protein